MVLFWGTTSYLETLNKPRGRGLYRIWVILLLIDVIQSTSAGKYFVLHLKDGHNKCLPKALVIAKPKPLRIWVWDRLGQVWDRFGTGLRQVLGTGFGDSGQFGTGLGQVWDRFGTGLGRASLSTSHPSQPKPKGHHKPS